MIIETATAKIGSRIDRFFSRWPKAKPWLWMVTLYLVGFLFLTLVAYGIRGLMPRPPVFK
ncbi:MAG TPA: hypothetical protein VGF14_01330 [Alphaproteobacteria bacterium]